MKNPKGANHWRNGLALMPALEVALVPRFT
jgi:hypothetical protein